jgi:hypothetical protein
MPIEERPDLQTVPERRIQGKTEREKFREQSDDEHLREMDENLALMRKHKTMEGVAFIIKYIGAWYIVLAIFKGIFYHFTPSFDVLGLVFFLFGMFLQHLNKKNEIKMADPAAL